MKKGRFWILEDVSGMPIKRLAYTSMIFFWSVFVMLIFLLVSVPVNAATVLYEDFEDGVLDSRITIVTTGTFNDPSGIKNITNFGSTKAFGFGRSVCGASCFSDYITVSTLSFKEMELYSNWGSGGKIYVDGTALTGGDIGDVSTHDFGRTPYNDSNADTTYRTKSFDINSTVTVIELVVWDITSASEIFIDDLSIAVCTPPPSNMVSWWKAENSGDDSVGTNHGTLQNGATFAAGKVGQAFSFDGMDDYIAIPNGIVPATARNFTVDAWVFPNDTSGQRYIVYGGPENNGGEYQFSVKSGNYSFKVKLSNASEYEVTSPATANIWAFVAGVRRGASLELWVDGVLKASRDDLPDLDLWTVGNGWNNSRIGAYNEFSDQNKEFWKGLIDEATIFNRALTAQEIAAIYNAGSVGMCPIQTYNLSISKSGTGSGTITSGPAGIDCGETCNADFNEGTDVTLTATPDAGSTFGNWGGDCSSCGMDTICTITMDEDKACSATFDLSPVSGPDLVVSSLTAPESARPGSLIRVRNSVTNQGTEKAGRSKVGFYLSANNNPSIDPEDLFMGSRNVPTLVGPRKLAPGKTSSTKKGIRIPSDTVAGTYYIKAKADYQDVVQETDETNNIVVSGEISIQ